jgi:hypothetical protein
VSARSGRAIRYASSSASPAAKATKMAAITAKRLRSRIEGWSSSPTGSCATTHPSPELSALAAMSVRCLALWTAAGSARSRQACASTASVAPVAGSEVSGWPCALNSVIEPAESERKSPVSAASSSSPSITAVSRPPL